MRKAVAVLAACLVLAGCGLGRWEAEIICDGQEQSVGFSYLNGIPLQLSKCRMA
ncbi:hypothetical protein ACWGE0_29775 [Lentzea sp. NPDC054927]